MENIMKSRIRLILALVLSFAGGLLIFLMDSSMGWDDTAITAGLLFVVAALSGLISPKYFWVWALLAGFWIPVNGIIKNSDFTFLFILLIPLTGALAGSLTGKAFLKRKDQK
jgi:hypothetical protein